MFACLDWRLHPQIEEFFSKSEDGCDACVTAGSVMGLIDMSTRDFFLGQVALSAKLHNCQSVVLTMHMDCGAYGGSAAFGDTFQESEHHVKILAEAQLIVARKFPGMNIDKFLVSLKKSGNDWIIDPQKID